MAAPGGRAGRRRVRPGPRGRPGLRRRRRQLTARRLAPVTQLRARAWRQTALRVPGCLPPVQPAPHAGRYHRVGDPWPLYASLDRATMWAEWSHATAGAIAPADDPRWVCALDLDLNVLDLRDAATRRALGVSERQLTGAWAPDAPNAATTRVMRAARELGVDGVVVPSAARAGGWNVAVLPAAFERVRLARRRRETPQAPEAAPAVDSRRP